MEHEMLLVPLAAPVVRHMQEAEPLVAGVAAGPAVTGVDVKNYE